MKFAHRFSGAGKPYEGLTTIRKGKVDWSGVARFIPSELDAPLRWKKPERIFVNSMSDLFHHSLTFEQIAAVFGVMAAAPRHQFLVLTKRPERMRDWATTDGIAAQVDLFKHVSLAGRIEEYFAPERKVAVDGWPGYWITSKGSVLTDRGAPACLWCGTDLGDFSARRKYCTDRCRQKADYEQRCGRWAPPESTERELRPLVGEQGHSRVMLYRGEETWRPLIHRLVLGAFDDSGIATADVDVLQGCHIDGDATNNALWNLRWGSQQANWEDRKRHGNGGPVEPPSWPLPNVWKGTSVENQETANERIPILLQCPAAVRWISAEPLIGPLNLHPWLCEHGSVEHAKEKMGHFCTPTNEKLNWVVVGGESGPGAREFNVDWGRTIVGDCAAAGVPVFLKQLGAKPLDFPATIADETGDNGSPRLLKLKSRKGGDPAEWPHDLRVREYPKGASHGP